MTDITEKLRIRADIHRHGAMPGGDLMAEAADEIERLRVALHKSEASLLLAQFERQEAADEIERLRAENERLLDSRDKWLDRLEQALTGREKKPDAGASG